MGKTIFACKIAKWLTYHRERVLYVNMASDHINIDTSDGDTIPWKCSLLDANHHHALADAEACAWIAREIL